MITGGIASSLFMLVILIGNGRALTSKDLVYPKMPISVEGCDPLLTAALNVSYIYEPEFTQGVNNGVFWLFRIAYRNNVLISFSVMLVATCIASLVFGVNDPRDMDHDLFSPCVRKFLPVSRVVKNKRQQPQEEVHEVEPRVEVKNFRFILTLWLRWILIVAATNWVWCPSNKWRGSRKIKLI